MLEIPRIVLFGTILAGMISIAGALLLELRRDEQRRRRLVKSVETLLASESPAPAKEEIPFKRAA